MVGPYENLLLRNVFARCILLIPNIWLERKKNIQPIKEMFSLLIAKYLGSRWGNFLFTQHVIIMMRTEHEIDKWHNSPLSLWRNIFSGLCNSVQHHLLVFDFCSETIWCQDIFKSILHEKLRQWAKKNTILTFPNRRVLSES